MAIIDRDIDSPLSQAAASLVLGSAEFIQNVQERYLGNRVGSRDLPALRQIHSGIDTEAFMAIVAEGLAKHPKHIRNVPASICAASTPGSSCAPLSNALASTMLPSLGSANGSKPASTMTKF